MKVCEIISEAAGIDPELEKAISALLVELKKKDPNIELIIKEKVKEKSSVVPGYIKNFVNVAQIGSSLYLLQQQMAAIDLAVKERIIGLDGAERLRNQAIAVCTAEIALVLGAKPASKAMALAFRLAVAALVEISGGIIAPFVGATWVMSQSTFIGKRVAVVASWLGSEVAVQVLVAWMKTDQGRAVIAKFITLYYTIGENGAVQWGKDLIIDGIYSVGEKMGLTKPEDRPKPKAPINPNVDQSLAKELERLGLPPLD